MIDPDKKVENEKNGELHEIELKCLAVGELPGNLFKDNDNQYVSVQKATEIMRTVEKYCIMCSSVQNVICSLMMKKDLKDILIHTKKEN